MLPRGARPSAAGPSARAGAQSTDGAERPLDGRQLDLPFGVSRPPATSAPDALRAHGAEPPLRGTPEVHGAPAGKEDWGEAGVRETEGTNGPPAVTAESLGSELEAALLRELRQSWRELNASLFRSSLRQPVLRLSRAAGVLGRWQLRRRSIEMSLPLLLVASWGEVIEVLKHEMAHQYVDEVVRATDEPAHGPAFRDVCSRLGVRPDATGPMPAAGEDDPSRARILRRVGDLLALARSSNLHEAEAAATAAQRLMLKYNVELAAERTPGRYGFAHLGEPTGRVPEHEHILAAILADYFFVQAIWVPVYRPALGKRGSVLEITGTEANLKIASYVHAFLRTTAGRLWEQHRKAMAIRSNRDRRTFLSGVMEGFRDKLARGKKSCQEQGLVWVGDSDLRRYHRQRHPHIRHVRLVGHERNEARARGREAGRRIVLHRAMDGTQGSTARVTAASGPRALPAPKRPKPTG